jgi:hypothetical protein
VINEQEKIYF